MVRIDQTICLIVVKMGIIIRKNVAKFDDQSENIILVKGASSAYNGNWRPTVKMDYVHGCSPNMPSLPVYSVGYHEPRHHLLGSWRILPTEFEKKSFRSVNEQINQLWTNKKVMKTVNLVKSNLFYPVMTETGQNDKSQNMQYCCLWRITVLTNGSVTVAFFGMLCGELE